MNFSPDLIDFVYFIIALIITLTVHEASHALVAYYLGDPTAKMRGRLTLNPIAHLDPVGSIVFLMTQSIGWGKPVPVNPNNFKNTVRDGALTALAGPMSNFILAFVMVFPWKFAGGYIPEIILIEVQTIFHVSIFLGIFNLFPLPPLDGSKIMGLFVPKKWHRGYTRFLMNGTKYFMAAILIDIFVIRSLFDFSFFGYVVVKLHGIVSMILLLGM